MKSLDFIMNTFVKKALIPINVNEAQYSSLLEQINELPKAKEQKGSLNVYLYLYSNIDKVTVEGLDNELIKQAVVNTMDTFVGMWHENFTLDYLKTRNNKRIEEATPQEICYASSKGVKTLITPQWKKTFDTETEENVKTVYYLSMEFLIGRLLSNNLLNLCIMNVVKKFYAKYNIDYNTIENCEMDAGLGNGGLGRLAACFLDSAATLGLPVIGSGIRYKYGFYDQKIEDGKQKEELDSWLKNGYPWEERRDEDAVDIKFKGYVLKPFYIYKDYEVVKAVPYFVPIIGYKSGHIGTLILWKPEYPNNLTFAQLTNETIRQNEALKGNAYEAIDLTLYPDDSNPQGKTLRIMQEYFYTSATVQYAFRECKRRENKVEDFPEKISFQLNDTHPAVAIAEIMRILLDDEKLSWEKAWDITTRLCGYTNHTVLAEALESWDASLYFGILPRIHDLIVEINRRFVASLTDKKVKEDCQIITMECKIRMANLAIIGSYSVNGVAKLHSNILQTDLFKSFYELYEKEGKNKFNNKTNGVSQRRFLYEANPRLSAVITKYIGSGWITNLDELSKLEQFIDTTDILKDIAQAKRENKVDFCNYVKSCGGPQLNPDSIFVVQSKRFHEYKRQFMSITDVLVLAKKIKAGQLLDMPHTTFIWAGKAAPSYINAKQTIHLINAVADYINNDPVVSKYINVYFIPNYNVTLAQKLISVADISQQISTASQEASGTGNMKFMMNGAITLGTLDGANIEILDEVGKENIFIFGYTAEQIKQMSNTNLYSPRAVCNSNYFLAQAMEQLVDGSLVEDKEAFRKLYNSIFDGEDGHRPDRFFSLADLQGYEDKLLEAIYTYKNQYATKWCRMALYNISRSGFFSSDRTILEYAKVWNIKPCNVSLS